MPSNEIINVSDDLTVERVDGKIILTKTSRLNNHTMLIMTEIEAQKLAKLLLS